MATVSPKRTKSLYGKLILVMLITCCCSVFISTVFLIAYSTQSQQSAQQSQYTFVAKILADKLASHLPIDQTSLLTEVLNDASQIEHLDSLQIYDNKGNFLAQLKEGKGEVISSEGMARRERPNLQSLEQTRPAPTLERIIQPINTQGIGQGITISQGTLVLEYEKYALFKLMLDNFGILLLPLLIIILFVSLVMSVQLKKIIFFPISALSHTMHKISRHYDYSLRAPINNQDEIGSLVDGFNKMIEKIQKHEELMLVEVKRRQTIQNQLQEQEKERIQLEYQVHQTTGNISDIINAMPSIVIGVKKDFTIKEWNRAAVRFTDVASTEAIGKPMTAVWSLLEMCRVQIEKTILNKEISKIEKVCFYSRGMNHYLDIMMYPLIFDKENGAVIRIDDITNQVRLEQRVQQTEKMLSVGGLAAGMSHEINNPLGGILQSLQNIDRRLKVGVTANEETAKQLGVSVEQVRSYLEKRGILKFLEGIKELGERAASIVQHMLQFSRTTDYHFVETDIHALLDRTINIIRQDADVKRGYDFKKITFKREYAANMPKIPCLPAEIEEVTLHLMKNAAQALFEDSAQTSKYSQQIIIRTHFDQNSAYIDIQDFGVGIDDKTRQHLFEPFFTTRAVGSGIGLGLSVAYFVINSKHNGEIKFESTLGQGSTFTIVLPLTQVELK